MIYAITCATVVILLVDIKYNIFFLTFFFRYVMQTTSQLVPKITLDLIDKIPGQLNDRRTMLGELNWIFTAITDTIAWNTLPRGN